MSYSAEVLADSPLAYWRLDDSTGNFADSSGNGHTASVTGTPLYGQPAAANLDGSSIGFSTSQYGNAGVVTWLDSLSALIVEAWIKYTSTSTRYIVARDTLTGNSGRGWSLRTSSGQINFYIFRNDGADFVANLTTPATYSGGEWQHVVATDENGGGLAMM